MESEKRNAVRQGIIHSDGCTENCMKLRINTKNKDASNTQDKAIANTYGDKFFTPLNFEMLTVRYPITNQGSETDML